MGQVVKRLYRVQVEDGRKAPHDFHTHQFLHWNDIELASELFDTPWSRQVSEGRGRGFEVLKKEGRREDMNDSTIRYDETDRAESRRKWQTTTTATTTTATYLDPIELLLGPRAQHGQRLRTVQDEAHVARAVIFLVKHKELVARHHALGLRLVL